MGGQQHQAEIQKDEAKSTTENVAGTEKFEVKSETVASEEAAKQEEKTEE